MTDSTTQPVVLTRRGGRPVELTRTQQQIWTSQRLHPEVPLANMAHRYRISGQLDAEMLVDAFLSVVRQADVLRLVIPEADGASAVVLDRPPRSVAVVDLDIDDLDEWCDRRIATPVDAADGVYDSVVLRHGGDDWTWWLNVHHIATDGWTAALIFDATSTAYAALRDNEKPPTIDGSYFGLDVAAQRRGGSPEERAAEWKSDLEAAGSPRPIAPYGPRGSRSTAVERSRLDFGADGAAAIEASLGDAYRSLSRELSTLAMAAMGAAIVTSRLEDRDSIVVGVPVHHRSGRTAGDVIGPLMELYPLAIDVDRSETNRDMFSRVLRSIMTMLRRARPGESPDADFEIVLNVLTERFHSFAGMSSRTEWLRPGHVDPNHVIRCHIFDHSQDGAEGTEWQVDVNAELSLDDSSSGFAEHLAAEVAALALSPDALVGTARRELAGAIIAAHALNPKPTVSEPLTLAHVQIADRLRSGVSWIVAEHGTDQINNAEFDERAGALAQHLMADGLEVGGRVGLRMGRCLDVLVAISGVLRAGGAFVMLAPADPSTRHDAIANDAELFTILDDLAFLRHREASVEDAPLPEIRLDDLAYVLYTSGSTGEPKGVPISHRGLADYLRFATAAYLDAESTAAPVVALHSELVFDLTITSLFLGPITGGLTVIFDEQPVEALGRIVRDDRITFIKATPSQLELFARLADSARPLHTVVVGGEAFRRPVAERVALASVPGVRIFNEYGPTEAVVGCMIHEWSPSDDVGPDVPIGAAAPGCQIVVLDRFGALTPPGAWGELFVRRQGMAQGYLNRPALSAERFVELPGDLVRRAVGDSADGAGVGDADGWSGIRWYATGDRVRVERPGVSTYGGRSDDQIKMNGVRLEPGEVEAALVTHESVTTALVGVWNPADQLATQPERCDRCGLGVDVPGTTIVDGVCNVCTSYDAVADQAEVWFKDDRDLDDRLADARRRATGDIDCLHLLSGGKDSTYALYQLVERGWRVHAFTLDNGFVSEGAKENVRRSVADLGISHEFATTDSMNEIFRDSLDRYANVCQGCYKTIYTLAVARAEQMGIPVIVTGLSRGQFFETRLVPHQFEAEGFDPDEIDRTVLEARRVYHQTPDAVTRLLPEQSVFDDPDVFDRVQFVDFYRYVDVDLAELYDFLENRAPWVRPADTGRSTNCLINVAGIQVHRNERGYHNYAEPYSWDVRLGHKTRAEALEELDDEVDDDEVTDLLAAVRYETKSAAVLTAWYQTADNLDVDPDVLRQHARTMLPEHAVPTAFVRIDEIPMASSAKADMSALPAPTRFHRRGVDRVEPTTPVEATLCSLWAEVLGLEAVGVTDDFFDLGGASLSALEVVAAVDNQFGTDLPDAIVFRSRTIRELAVIVADALASADGDDVTARAGHSTIASLDGAVPPLSAGQEAMLFEYRSAPGDPRYNVTRLYSIRGELDIDRLAEAAIDVGSHHEPLHRAYDGPRTRLAPEQAVRFTDHGTMLSTEFEQFAHRRKRDRFDLDAGPLLRVDAARTPNGESRLLLGLHHISVDAGTFDVLWHQIADRYAGGAAIEPEVTYGEHTTWQAHRLLDVHADDAGFWRQRSEQREPLARLGFRHPSPAEPDGYIGQRSSISPQQLTGSGGTAFARSMAAAAMTFARFTGSTTAQFGITSSTRDHPDAADIVGYYLNTLPVALAVTGEKTFGQMTAAAEQIVGESLPHRRYPFASMVRDARAEGLVPPSVDFMLAFEELSTPLLSDFEVNQEILSADSAVSDVTFFVQQRADRIDVGIEYRGALLGRSDAQRMLDHFDRVLNRGTLASDRPLDGLVTVDAEPDLVGAALPDAVSTVLQRFAQRLVDAPLGAAAIDADGRAMSAIELAARAERLVRRVEASNLSGSASRLGVAVPRSTGVAVAMLAAMASGSAYVPLDPSLAPGRLAQLISSASLDAIITTASGQLVARLDDVGVPIVEFGPDDGIEAGIETGNEEGNDADLADALARRIAAVTLDQAAYVIFTSGSTGVPRGVEVSHRNLASSTAARDHWYDESPSRFLVTSSIGFDSSIVGLFWPLVTGGAIVFPTDDDVIDVDRLGVVIERADVSHTLMVPSLYAALLQRAAGRLSGLSTAIVAGEQCPIGIVHQHHELLPGVGLVNEYGPTEATVWSTAHRLGASDDRVLIGEPIPGTVARVVDPQMRSVERGLAGELLVAGPGVTAGYLDDAQRTADRFVELDVSRWYRTGDLVRVTNQLIEFVGRVDEQLNIGGNRLEPGEVEAELRKLEGVDDAVVVAAGDVPMLVAHLEASDFDVDAARTALAEVLPVRSIPRRFVVHDRLPRSSRGKVDRHAAARLPVGIADPVIDADAAPGTDGLVDVVVAAWRRVFGDDTMSADADFFEAGGDSLVAVALVIDVGTAIGHEVPIATLLAGRTATGMAIVLAAEGLTDHLGATRSGEEFPLVTMRAGRSDGPLVVLTPAWDDIFGYQALADSFDDDVTVVAALYDEQPGKPVIGTVTELVTAFLPRLVLMSSERPAVAFAGWSIGGVVAAELGDRLRDAGGRADFVALIDTFYPGEASHRWSNRWWKYKSMLQPGSLGEAGKEARKMLRRRGQRYAARIGRSLLAWSGNPIPVEPERTSLKGFPVSALVHDIPRVRTPLLMFGATTTNPDRTVNKWRAVADDFTLCPIEGRHRGLDSVMDRGRVEQISNQLTHRLR